MGIRRVRLTGGEPLVRKDLCELSARLSRLPRLEDLSLSTNASLLAKNATDLKQASITRINISLDTLKPERFRDINGGKLSDTLDGLMAAKAAGFAPLKINMVAMKNINDDEFNDRVNFCLEHDFTLRFIETMPINAAGRKTSQHYLALHDVEKCLQKTLISFPV